MQINSSTWAEINLENIKYNVNSVKNKLSPHTKLCCVVKANAYGHGAIEVSKYLDAEENVEFFSVARMEEALELVSAGIKTPILCMGYTETEKIKYAVENNIRLTVYSLDMAKKINEIGRAQQKKAYIHLKIDTGMSRLGFLVNPDSLKALQEIFTLEYIIVEGIYTHFAKADEKDKSFTYEQLRKFNTVIKYLEAADLDIPIRHVSNSAAILDLRDTDFNMVRLGISLYGSYPSEEVSKAISLKPCLQLKTKVSHIKTIEEGSSVSYGARYVASQSTQIATLPVGYADGFPRTQQNPKAFINGHLLNIVGRICMDQCMVEIPDEIEVNMGDEAVLIGNTKGIKIGDIARRVGTIDHEIFCCLTKRVNRIYIK